MPRLCCAGEGLELFQEGAREVEQRVVVERGVCERRVREYGGGTGSGRAAPALSTGGAGGAGGAVAGKVFADRVLGVLGAVAVLPRREEAAVGREIEAAEGRAGKAAGSVRPEGLKEGPRVEECVQKEGTFADVPRRCRCRRLLLQLVIPLVLLILPG